MPQNISESEVKWRVVRKVRTALGRGDPVEAARRASFIKAVPPPKAAEAQLALEVACALAALRLTQSDLDDARREVARGEGILRSFPDLARGTAPTPAGWRKWSPSWLAVAELSVLTASIARADVTNDAKARLKEVRRAAERAWSLFKEHGIEKERVRDFDDKIRVAEVLSRLSAALALTDEDAALRYLDIAGKFATAAAVQVADADRAASELAYIRTRRMEILLRQAVEAKTDRAARIARLEKLRDELFDGLDTVDTDWVLSLALRADIRLGLVKADGDVGAIAALVPTLVGALILSGTPTAQSRLAILLAAVLEFPESRRKFHPFTGHQLRLRLQSIHRKLSPDCSDKRHAHPLEALSCIASNVKPLGDFTLRNLRTRQ